MSDDLVKRLRGTPLYEGNGEESDLQDEAADAIAALTAERDALRDALAPFAKITGEGDEDFPDDAPVSVTFGRTTAYELTLADFRNARKATK